MCVLLCVVKYHSNEYVSCSVEWMLMITVRRLLCVVLCVLFVLCGNDCELLIGVCVKCVVWCVSCVRFCCCVMVGV